MSLGFFFELKKTQIAIEIDYFCQNSNQLLKKKNTYLSKKNCIGAFDSGVGGLSVLREMIKLLPNENFIYLADQKNVPYGKKTLDQVRRFSEINTRYLLAKGAKIIAIPCNTATGAALDYLRKTFPSVPFVGMEPAIKPAAKLSKTRKVAILATAGTFKSQRYGSLIERFGKGIEVIQNPCIGLVELIESGKTNSPETRDFLKKVTAPMLKAGVDTIVLGCTHYPFIQPILEDFFPKGINIIDPAPAVAQQVKRRLENLDLLGAKKKGSIQFCTTGNIKSFETQIEQLIDYQGVVKGVDFRNLV